MLMAAGIEALPRLRVHGYLLVGGEKMSKTRLNQIAPGELIETFGVDGVRYHFLRDTPFGPDGDFSFEGMIARYNADLANQLGNLLQRVSTVVHTKCGGIGPAPRADSVLGPIVDEVYGDVVDAWRDTQPSVALEATWRIIRATNDYLQSNEPWKMEPGPAVDAVMGDALEALRVVAILASPAMPAACDAIWRRIGMAGSVLDQRLPAAARWGGYPGGRAVAAAEPLFPRLKG
jgi:methionyl-tRNA synthetase